MYITVQVWRFAYTNNGGIDGRSCESLGGAPNDVFAPYGDFEPHRAFAANAMPYSEMFSVDMWGSGTQSFDNVDCLLREGAQRSQRNREFEEPDWICTGQCLFSPDSRGRFGLCCGGSNGNIQCVCKFPGMARDHRCRRNSSRYGGRGCGIHV